MFIYLQQHTISNRTAVWTYEYLVQNQAPKSMLGVFTIKYLKAGTIKIDGTTAGGTCFQLQNFLLKFKYNKNDSL